MKINVPYVDGLSDAEYDIAKWLERIQCIVDSPYLSDKDKDFLISVEEYAIKRKKLTSGQVSHIEYLEGVANGEYDDAFEQTVMNGDDLPEWMK